MNMAVTLNEGEQRIARWLGKARSAANRAAGIVDRQLSDKLSGEEGDIEGVGAEIAFAKLFNVYPDLSLDPRRGGYDCTLLEITIDVKTTRYPTGHLVATLKKKLGDSRFYALMVGEFPSYEFKGLCLEDQLITKKRITDLGRGPTYAVPQGDPSIITADDIFGPDES